jgi:SMC interacting uncharacterized protein involved in chromosome segregation
MSNKITDARIKELQRLKDRKTKLTGQIQTRKDEMQKILDSMDDKAQGSASSSSRAAKAARGKASSSLNHQDVIDAHNIAIAKWKEELSEVEKELKDLETITSV